MNYGICNLSNIPLRAEPDDKSELVSQVLFGDSFEIIGKSKQWLKIKLAFDDHQGWIDAKQCIKMTKNQYEKLDNSSIIVSNELVDFIEDDITNELISIVLGSKLPFYTKNSLNINGNKYVFEGTTSGSISSKESIIKTAFMYLNTPYLWGGKTPFGIDSSGLTQMVYKINGHKLFRDASQQATQGEVLSFIEESEPGDLAFFDNNEGDIIHVGIILANNYIIHASGKVRIDRLDQSGIYNAELRKHTHKLRVIKKIF